MLDTNLSTAPDGLRVYAVQRPDGRVTLTALNLSLEHPIDLAIDHKFSGKPLIRLQAPSPSAKSGETLGNAAIKQMASGTQPRTKPQAITCASPQPAPH